MIENTGLRKIPKRKEYFVPFSLVFSVSFFILSIIGMLVFAEDIRGELPDKYYLVFFLGILLSVILGKYAELLYWRNFASYFELSYEEYKQRWGKWPQIKGTYKGFPLVIEKISKKVDGYRVSYTSLKIILSGQNTEVITISSTPWFSDFREAIWGGDRKFQQVQLGDDSFSRKLEVKSTSEQVARYILSSHSIQQGLVEIQSQTRSMRIEIYGNELYYFEQEIVMDADYLAAVMRILVELAESLGRYR
ncbi:MAG: DUF3137 domain-containing protein [Chloroflexi bacterium]|nr:DUF3137 domain-containing protein [Chloroflexota bacterium]